MVYTRLGRGLLLSLAMAGQSIAPSWALDSHDHDRARQALEAGEILPLRAILERVEREYPGKIMEVELEQKGEHWVYEIRLLRTGGALVKLKVDGRTGDVLDSAERQGRRSRHP